MTNGQVAKRFIEGRECTSSNGNMRTDGVRVWSYHTVVAEKYADGRAVWVTDRRYTISTQGHLRAIIRAALSAGRPLYRAPYPPHGKPEDYPEHFTRVPGKRGAA